MRRIAVLDAPSNLGLRPPTATSVPGCAKAPGALRDQDLLHRLGARDAGCVTPPRYDPGDWRPGDGVCHAESIGWYSRRLADRIGEIIDAGEFPLVLGGDCSILLGSALAVRRMADRDDLPYGLVYVDGHSDFRHPGNASYVGAAAGEGLALVTGRGQPDLTNLEGLRPYVRDEHLVLLGIRAQDDYRLDLQAAGLSFRPVPQLRGEGAGRTASWAREQLSDCIGYWLHVDVDVLDPAVMPAVDAPDEGGIAFAELELLIAGLVDTPDCLGMQVTVYDPDYDPDGEYARELVSTLVSALEPVRRREQRPARPLSVVMPSQRSAVEDAPAPAPFPPAEPPAVVALALVPETVGPQHIEPPAAPESEPVVDAWVDDEAWAGDAARGDFEAAVDDRVRVDDRAAVYPDGPGASVDPATGTDLLAGDYAEAGDQLEDGDQLDWGSAAANRADGQLSDELRVDEFGSDDELSGEEFGSGEFADGDGEWPGHDLYPAVSTGVIEAVPADTLPAEDRDSAAWADADRDDDGGHSDDGDSDDGDSEDGDSEDDAVEGGAGAGGAVEVAGPWSSAPVGYLPGQPGSVDGQPAPAAATEPA